MDNNENNMNNENLVEENTSAKETNGVDENGGYVSQFGRFMYENILLSRA